MENGFLQNWPRIPEGQRLQLRKKIFLFSLFLLISVFIWLLNALSKNYSSVIKYPLVFSGLPDERVFIGDLPEQLDLHINAHGYALLRYQLIRKPQPLSFSLSASSLLRPGQDSGRSYILTRYMREQLARQLPSEIELLEIKPDTLYFSYSLKVTRRVKIEPDFRFTLDKQFTIKDGIILQPDSVEITGPDFLLDTLRYATTERTNLGTLSRNYREKVRLHKLEGLEYTLSRVDCLIELEKFTEIQLTVPVEVINLPDTLAMQTFPSRVKLTCKVGLSKYDRINNNPFRAVVDFSEIVEQQRELDVTIQNLPLYLLSYEYYPRSVEFLIARK